MEEKQKTTVAEPSEWVVCQKQAEEYLNNWKRERADFINYKKDEAKRLEKFAEFANKAVILEVVEVFDDLEIAQKHGDNKEGLDRVMKKFADWRKGYGIERIKVAGEKFNPELHEAVEGSVPEGEKLEEIRAGYTMHGKVIRPARVKIIK
jgi:molecular chaperone GrpE